MKENMNVQNMEIAKNQKNVENVNFTEEGGEMHNGQFFPSAFPSRVSCCQFGRGRC